MLVIFVAIFRLVLKSNFALEFSLGQCLKAKHKVTKTFSGNKHQFKENNKYQVAFYELDGRLQSKLSQLILITRECSFQMESIKKQEGPEGPGSLT